jgi:hypothetical protein
VSLTRQLVAGPRKAKFDSKPFHVEFMVGEVTVRRASLGDGAFPFQYHSTNALHSVITQRLYITLPLESVFQ